MEVAPLAGVPIAEQKLMPRDLISADEVFISSTNRNLLGVSEIAGEKIAAAPGPITLKLEIAFAEFVAKYVAARKATTAFHARPPINSCQRNRMAPRHVVYSGNSP